MANYEVTGCIKVIMDEMAFDSGFRKREFVITVPDDHFPQDIKLSALKDRISILNDVQVGEDVTVFFDLRGHEYNGRYFVDLVAWKLSKNDSQQDDDTGSPAEAVEQDGNIDWWKDDDEDLPFG